MNNELNNTNQQPTITNTTSTVPTAPAVPTATQPVAPAVPTATQPVAPLVASVPSAPVAPQQVAQPTQQRVQLVNDKPALHAIAPSDIPKMEDKSSENIEVLETAGSNINNNTEDKKGNGCFTNFFLFALFGGLFAFIFFIDDITSYVNTKKYLDKQVQEVITTGTLKCSSERSTSNMDYTYLANFEYRDSKLKRLNYTMEIRGDISLDEVALNELYNECLLVKEYAGSLSGIDITCSLENGLLKEKQVFTYDSVNREEAMSAFIEAGGIYPEYKKDQSIDEIEKTMNAAAYTCERIK